MNKMLKLSAFLTATALAGVAAPVVRAAPAADPVAAPGATQRQPNFLVIVADDLGWSDLGAFGGEIQTPNLDAIANAGVRFTGFHTAPTCSPTRSMLLSGVDNHQAGVGSMAETLQPNQIGQPGYEGYLNDRVASIAELLHQGGYRTLMSGKWHLGLTPERGPAARGFERSYALLQGLGNHFGADQNKAWAAIGGASTYRDNGRIVKYPKGRYSADYFTDRLIGFLEEGAKDQRPFFAYLPYTTPHWPMQAPAETIAKYKGRYDAGYEALREARLARQKQLGLVPVDLKPHDWEGVKPWASLSADEKAIEARKMEVYAAMVDRMDQNVGRVVEVLKKLGRYDDTVIIFLADNGPEGNVIEAPFQAALKPDKLPALRIDNSLDNIGKASSYVGYGPGWAQANSSPSWLVKSYPTEGGTRVTAFVAGRGVAGRRIAGGLFSVTDVAPTLLDLAGLQQPATFAGHAILPFQGHSLVPVLTGGQAEVRQPTEAVGTELFYRRALRKGDWKAVYLPTSSSAYPRNSVGTGVWQLFNVAQDPAEAHDLAAAEPAKLKELVADWDSYAKDKGVVLPPPEAAKPEGAAKP
ncbi:arylsulfatase [Sphingobium indicum IP26]|uniref:Arylsulfatase n=1 Tax=Sphingobium indicum F2 TaxID=1450518 RepID=A0A8E0WT63_9SPHN|nr:MULTISPECIES: arylsulfatase [Sphingobium]EPR11792.1 arylsulfatase [Sphingobium indicum IP26]EQB01553.1 arylsulfatase [Sphingobium sp. HDIP04]KER36978.1 arylsulfatase [Sphingobium indicum F2]